MLSAVLSDMAPALVVLGCPLAGWILGQVCGRLARRLARRSAARP